MSKREISEQRQALASQHVQLTSAHNLILVAVLLTALKIGGFLTTSWLYTGLLFIGYVIGEIILRLITRRQR